MQLRLTFAALTLLALGAPAARAADKCAAHQHVAVEKDEDEGGTMKRCVCDDGFVADAPGGPCHKAKIAGGKKPKK